MNSPFQHRCGISSMRLRAASVVLALAAVLVPVVVTSQPSQAQTFTTLYSFPGTPNGARPEEDLIRGAAGNLYGTTIQGGAIDRGTVFEVSRSGNEAVLYSFTGSGGDGAYPAAGVIDAKGDLYGTTLQGGDLTCNPPYVAERFARAP